MSKPAIAIIATSHAEMGDTGEPTGVWLEELTAPYYAFLDAGHDVHVFSIAGGAIPIDPRSLGEDAKKDESVARYLSDDTARDLFANTKDVAAVDLADYAAVFLPGGHGTMFDYPESDRLADLLGKAMDAGKTVAAVCHGPAGLVNATLEDGISIVKGRRVAGFTNSEEEGVGLTDAVPFLLETKLKELGADYQSGPDFQPFTVRDGNLITGQNPASAAPTAEKVIEALAG